MTVRPDDKKAALRICLERLRAQDQAAFDELLEEYNPLICNEVARHGEGLGSQDVEDLRQLALLALYRAALAFDLEQGEVEFGLYAKICISNALVSQLRVIRRRAQEISTDFIGSLEIGAEDPAARIVEQEAFDALYDRIRTLLSPYENRVWSMYMAGRSSGEIAKILQKDPHSVENAVYRIRRKLRAALGGHVTRH